MSSKQKVRRWVLAGALAVGLMSTASSSQAYEWYPGLPDSSFGNWNTISQGGLAYTKRAKQWFRSPQGMVVSEFDFRNLPGEASKYRVRAEGYFISPDGAPENYGYLAPMTVRSVGFGLMPVEATVQISQRRSNGLPLPIKVTLGADYDYIKNPDGTTKQVDIHYPSITVADSFNVQILSVRVDGVDMELNGDCRTVEPAPFTMQSPAYVREDVSNNPEDEWFGGRDPDTYFHPFWGGNLTGSMTIPAFTGCTTNAGDDLSRLMTLSASGPGNPIVGRAGFPKCGFAVGHANAPAPPGMSNPKKADCPGPKPFDYPERPAD